MVSALSISIVSALGISARAADPPPPDVAIEPEAGAALEEVVVLAAKRPQPLRQVKAGLSLPVWRDHLFVGAEVRYRSPVRLGLGSLDLPKGWSAQLKVYDVTAQPWVEPSLAEDSRPIVRIPHGGPTAVLRLSYGF
jgi:hypothetical protein